jgi:hypothetical protein
VVGPIGLGAQYTTTGTSFKDSILLGGGQSAERFPDGKNFALALPKSIAVSSLGGLAYKKYLMDKQVDTDTYPIRYGAYVGEERRVVIKFAVAVSCGANYVH